MGSSFSAAMAVRFGPLSIPKQAVMSCSNEGAVALRGLEPILPGHCVVIPKRRVQMLKDLTPLELQMLFACVMETQASLERGDVDVQGGGGEASAEGEGEVAAATAAAAAADAAAAAAADAVAAGEVTGFNLCVKDGDSAGQAVPHVHVHVIPRRPGDLERNDEVYERIDEWSPVADDPAVADFARPIPLDIPDDDERGARTAEDMAAEADRYAFFAAATLGAGSGVCMPFSFGGAAAGSAAGAGAGAVGRARPGPHEAVFFSPKIRLDPRQVFWVSKTGLTMALVNLKPLVRGHVLVVPRRCAAVMQQGGGGGRGGGGGGGGGGSAGGEGGEDGGSGGAVEAARTAAGGVPGSAGEESVRASTARCKDLTPAEREDLWDSVRKVMAIVLGYYGATGATLGLQDGRDAGQSVPHVHVHILPRGGPGEGEAAPGDCFPPPAPGATQLP